MYFWPWLKGALSLQGMSLESRGIKIDAPSSLREVDTNGTQRSVDGFWFEAAGVAFAGVSAFVRSRLESGSALEAHRLIEEGPDNLTESLGAFCSNDLEELEEAVIFKVRVGCSRARVGSLQDLICIDLTCSDRPAR
jgi:hypothetical protein